MIGSQNIGAMYDSWLLQQADDFMSSGCEGEPEIIHSEKIYEGTDEDGNIEYSWDHTYNCEECDERDCEHWAEFHDEEEEEDDNGTN